MAVIKQTTPEVRRLVLDGSSLAVASFEFQASANPPGKQSAAADSATLGKRLAQRLCRLQCCIAVLLEKESELDMASLEVGGHLSLCLGRPALINK